MKILLTGGTGVIGAGLIPALRRSGHTVRLLTRHADRDAGEWPGDEVESWAANVAEPETLEGAADGCDAVIHVVGIVAETPPAATFERVNVEGTRHVVREAERAGVRRLLYLSSLGADTGDSAYHRSKRAAERIVAGFTGAWTILRPGAVYGPGDEVVSSLLVLVRSLPAVPVLGDGEQRFQPLWYEDLGEAIARTLERDDLAGRTLELAGGEVTTTNDLLDRFERLEGRDSPRLSVPDALASLGQRIAERIPLTDLLERVTGLDLPIDPAKLAMLREENFIRSPESNALTAVLGLTPLPLDEGLRRLAAEIPERLPEDGLGPLQRKRFWADIRGSRLGADGLMEVFRRECRDLLPVAVLDGSADRPIERGDTLRLELPGRGHVQVRVEEASAEGVSLATLDGHPLAGLVRFSATDQAGALRFSIEILARASGLYDLVLMAAAGDGMQTSTWEEAVRRVVERSGGTAPAGVHHERAELEGEEASAAERRVARMVRARRAADNARRG